MIKNEFIKVYEDLNTPEKNIKVEGADRPFDVTWDDIKVETQPHHSTPVDLTPASIIEFESVVKDEPAPAPKTLNEDIKK